MELTSEERKNKSLMVLHFIAAFGFMLDWYIYYPGFISPDSLDQYYQAFTHNFNDWHPPIMAGFWSLLLTIKEGSELMFFFQVFFYWFSFLIIGKVLLKYSVFSLFAISLFFFAPFMQNFVGNIWKDVGLAISWLFALSLIISALLKKRKLSWFESIIALLFLSYGAWIRINALPGVIPLISLWLYSLNYQEGQNFNFRKIVLKTSFVCILLIVVQILITDFALKPKKQYPEYKLFMHDLTGIYKESGEQYYPDFLITNPNFDTIYLKKHYVHSTFDNIWWNSDNKNIIPGIDSKQSVQLRNSWLFAIKKHPWIYLKNRTLGFLDFLRITDSGSLLMITYNYTPSNNFGLNYKSKKLTDNIRFLIESQRHMPYMKPWFWFLTTFLLLIFALKKLSGALKIIILSLTYSSLLYFALEFIVFQADTEFRYFYWNCIAISLSLILIITNHFSERHKTVNKPNLSTVNNGY